MQEANNQYYKDELINMGYPLTWTGDMRTTYYAWTKDSIWNSQVINYDGNLKKVRGYNSRNVTITTNIYYLYVC